MLVQLVAVVVAYRFYSLWSEEEEEKAKAEEERRRAVAEQRQGAQVVAFCTGVVALGYQFYSWWSEEKAEEERHSDAPYQHAQQLNNSYTRKNHDHLKVKHKTHRDAQAEVDRMRREGREGSERLNAYYNYETKGWYVGKGWKDNTA